MQQGRLNTWLTFTSVLPEKLAHFPVGANTAYSWHLLLGLRFEAQRCLQNPGRFRTARPQVRVFGLSEDVYESPSRTLKVSNVYSTGCPC